MTNASRFSHLFWKCAPTFKSCDCDLNSLPDVQYVSHVAFKHEFTIDKGYVAADMVIFIFTT